MKLEELAKMHGTDKQKSMHNYVRWYEKLLEPKREKVKKVVEIGVLNGSSLRMWRDYFPNAVVWGVDVNPETMKHKGERIEIVISDQTNPNLPILLECDKRFDFVVDDGSHMSSHQISTFNLLFPWMNQEALYVVEDVCCSYWDSHEGGLKRAGTCIEFFKEKVDELNFHGMRGPNVWRNRDYLFQTIKTVTDFQRVASSISFFDSAIAIETL